MDSPKSPNARIHLVWGCAFVAACFIGYLAYKSSERTDLEKAAATNGSALNAPLLTSPKVRRVWVPAKIEGEKYIDGHYMFVIEKTSGWSN